MHCIDIQIRIYYIHSDILRKSSIASLPSFFGTWRTCWPAWLVPFKICFACKRLNKDEASLHHHGNPDPQEEKFRGCGQLHQEIHLKGKLARRQICVLKTDGLVFDPIAQERGLFNGGLKCPTWLGGLFLSVLALAFPSTCLHEPAQKLAETNDA